MEKIGTFADNGNHYIKFEDNLEECSKTGIGHNL